MPATAENLRDLHALHQRAKALRDRLTSAPKTLAARQQILATRTAAIEAASKAIKDLKAQQKTKETSAQAIKEKTSDLRVKLNAIKKQVEYDAIRNQIAHDNATLARLDDETLELMGKVEEQSAAMAVAAAEIKVVEAEVAKISGEIEAKAIDQGAPAQGTGSRDPRRRRHHLRRPARAVPPQRQAARRRRVGLRRRRRLHWAASCR